MTSGPIMDANALKRAAAARALDFVEDGMKLGLGTGSTAEAFLDLLAERMRGGLKIVGTPTSERTQKKAAALGIPIMDLNDLAPLDLVIDGADEADARLDLIKGGGGALTREKIVAAVARKFVCICDGSKLVDVLGKFPLPVEVLPMARSYVARELVKLGGQPAWRQGFTTDNGNWILDVHNLSITNPAELEATINQITGVVTNGLFARRGADVLVLGAADGVKTINKNK